MSLNSKIIGRYAPSPTGDLHLGNVRTAMLAWLHARVQGGQFLLRIEDLDMPRVVPGSADKILQDLEWLGLNWDGEIVYQSRRDALYASALATLDAQQLVYPCFCSRKDIRQAASAPHTNPNGANSVYPGTCRHLSSAQIAEKEQQKRPSIRVVVDGSLSNSCGDFVVKRADKLFAYQLAVVVDDLEQGVTEAVRGADLLDSTERQCYLAEKLRPDQEPINYLHAPLMMDSQGQRLSKRDGSQSISECRVDGYTPDTLIAELAYGLGLIDQPSALSMSELLDEITLTKLAGVLSE